MRVSKHYTSQALSEGSVLKLEDNAAQHLGRVLRAKAGDPIILFNGDGQFYSAEITLANKKTVEVRILDSEASTSESPLSVHIGQVMSRGERMDYMIQKSTELGVNTITPLFSERCEVKLQAERMEKKQRHWQGVAISAAEQCGRARVPKIETPVTLKDWVTSNKLNKECDLSLVLHHSQNQSLADIEPKPESVRILIGPEGGLSETEIKLSENKGFITSTFGPRVFRTETAPVVALSLVQWLWGDF